MSYLTNWYCISDDIYNALKTGEIREIAINELAKAVPERLLIDVSNEFKGFYDVDTGIKPAEGIKTFFQHIRSGTVPEAHGFEITLLVMGAVRALGEQHGDFSEGSPSHLEWLWSEIYSKVPLLSGLGHILNDGFGYCEGFPYFSLVSASEVASIAQGLESLGEEQREQMEEEYDGLGEIVASAMEDGRNVVTITS